jgi:hypothetical protein
MLGIGENEPVIARASAVIERPPCDIFRFLGDGFFENYPKWSPEVVNLDKLTDGPLQLGTTARQVRIDQGRRTETEFTINMYEPNKRLGFSGVSAPFRCIFELSEVEPEKSSELIFTFELIEIQGFMRPFEKIIHALVQDGVDRTVKNLKRLLEAGR